MSELSKLLIANRGEIACRIIRSARDMGLRTVAVYSDADRDARHVALADEAVPIGAAPVGESYLHAEKIIEACRISGADAVHPGYGFLSENSDFARMCEKAGVTFVGPPADAIQLMGSKRLSKQAMIDAGVPCIPGYQSGDQSDARLLQEAIRIGFPLMVKASAGGGGRGMRLVERVEDLANALVSARSEARTALGSEELILERAVHAPRHIEIQVFADAHGNVVHLGERDCSIQRRHQKVVEESPSPFVGPELRERMGRAAIKAARACEYRGAGTVEFLVDGDGNFYFLEMNTRLQVEHPVTELVTGVDLVEWQLRVGMGEPLPLSQDQICLDGWAIEARLYAEDPKTDFMPQTGTVLRWDGPCGSDLRVDHGVREGQAIGPHYDPMLAKIIAYGQTRSDARRKLARAVEDTVLLGVNNNKTFLAAILRHDVFAAGQATTAFLSEHFGDHVSTVPSDPSIETKALAAAVFFAQSKGGLLGWSNAVPRQTKFKLDADGRSFDLALTAENHGGVLHCVAQTADERVSLEILKIGRTCIDWLSQGLRRKTRYAAERDHVFLDGPLGNIGFRNITHTPVGANNESGTGQVITPMDGSIVSVNVAVGDHVSRGQSVAVLEAMKMEHQLISDVDGVVDQIFVQKGDQLKTRTLVAVVRANDESFAAK